MKLLASGRFIESRERLSDPAGRLPGRKGDQHQSKKGHDGERELKLSGICHGLGGRIGKQEDGPLAVRKGRERLCKCDRLCSSDHHLEGRLLADMHLRQRGGPGVERGHAARGFGPAAVAIGDHRRVQRNGRQSLEAAHLVAVEICGKNDPADERRGHDRRGDQLARTARDDEDPGQLSIVERLPDG